jgi:hypothetical protein
MVADPDVPYAERGEYADEARQAVADELPDALCDMVQEALEDHELQADGIEARVGR